MFTPGPRLCFTSLNDFFFLPPFTGTRDKSGRAVAIITTRNTIWLNPHCNTTELVRLLLYLHSIPRFVALGLTGGAAATSACLVGCGSCGGEWTRVLLAQEAAPGSPEIVQVGISCWVSYLVFSKHLGYCVRTLQACAWS